PPSSAAVPAVPGEPAAPSVLSMPWDPQPAATSIVTEVRNAARLLCRQSRIAITDLPLLKRTDTTTRLRAPRVEATAVANQARSRRKPASVPLGRQGCDQP